MKYEIVRNPHWNINIPKEWLVVDEYKHIIDQFDTQEDAEVCIKNQVDCIRVKQIINSHDELLEACKTLLNMFIQDHRDCKEWDQYKQAKQAIAKAEGKQ